MQSGNTYNDAICDSVFLFLKNGFAFFAVLWCSFFHSQIKVSEGTTLFLAEKTIIYNTDSAAVSQENQAKSQIFISFENQISHLDSEIACEIVEISTPEKKKNTPTKQISSKTSSPFEKKVKHRTVSKIINDVATKVEFSSQETESYFSFQDVFFQISVPASEHDLKLVFHSEKYKTSLTALKSDLVPVSLITNEILTAQNKSAFSVRPPPFLI